MRVFLDTNVLASAVATRGLCSDLFESVLAEHELIISEALLVELDSILRLKLKIHADVTRGFATLITEMAAGLAVGDSLPEGIPDPDDAPLIAAALAGGAACFVTGDKALLGLEQVEGMPIVSPRQFWERSRLSR